MGGEELKWHQLAHIQLMSKHKDLIFVHTVQLKPTVKAQMASIGISNVVTASVYSEKIHLKKLMMIMIMNKSQETTVFQGCQKLTSAMKLSLKSDGRLQN